MTIKIGLTGSIGSGKSTVDQMLKEEGITVIDADVIGRQIIMPHQPAWQKVVQTWGEEILLPDKEINRPKLAEIIFNDPAERKKLDDITHPLIISRIMEQIKETKDEIFVVTAPLLIEAGLVGFFDEIWLVTADEETVIKRLTRRDHLSEEDALKRIKSQLPLSEKRKFASRLINNNGSVKETKQQIKKQLQLLRRKKQ